MQIEDKKIVVINYTLTTDDDEVLDKSDDGSFAYLHGADNIIAGLESALVGKTVGDTLNVKVLPAEGYGERNDEMVQVVGKEMFESDEELEVGSQFHAEGPDGQPIMITVAAIEGDDITIDGNHPLAGMNLNFDVSIVDIRDASEEEISHGHVHGPDGHKH
ncbi:FKBP-type peptidyl-prolyl cis-trans isomerase SlyD [hydrothermal vent metagenome]|uniref:peptidylprolyl isomerase n=1 Tax=hydrothermal vent metagenome TaxID=652676 RepID=A0A3B0ZNU1_9ZZZZ